MTWHAERIGQLDPQSVTVQSVGVLIGSPLCIAGKLPFTFGSIGRSGMFSHFRKLCDDLPFVREKVADLESPNPDDDRMVKFGIVGYAYYQPVASWGPDEFDFVDQRRHEVDELGPLWGEFVCLATGYLLGMYQAGQCSDADCALFEAALPGFMWQHSEQFVSIVDEGSTGEEGRTRRST